MVKKGKNKNYVKYEAKPEAKEEKPDEQKEEVKVKVAQKEDENIVEKKEEKPAEDEESEIDDWDAADSDELAAKLDKKDCMVLEDNQEDNNLAETVKKTE